MLLRAGLGSSTGPGSSRRCSTRTHGRRLAAGRRPLAYWRSRSRCRSQSRSPRQRSRRRDPPPYCQSPPPLPRRTPRPTRGSNTTARLLTGSTIVRVSWRADVLRHCPARCTCDQSGADRENLEPRPHHCLLDCKESSRLSSLCQKRRRDVAGSQARHPSSCLGQYLRRGSENRKRLWRHDSRSARVARAVKSFGRVRRLPLSRYRRAGRWLPRPRNAIELVRLTVGRGSWTTIFWRWRAAHSSACWRRRTAHSAARAG
jgi:hypothetical protein